MSQIPNEQPAAPAAVVPVDSGSLLGGSNGGSVNDTLMGGVKPVDSTEGTGGTPPVTDAPPVTEPVVGLAPLPENATEDQKRDFNNKLRAYKGVPDAPEKYGDFGFGESVKIDTNSEEYKYYTSVFHELGLNQADAKKLLEKHKEFADKQVEHYQKQNDKAILDYRAKVKADFIKEQGGEAKYEVFRSVAEQGFKNSAKGAGMTDTEVRGLLNIMGDDPRFVKLFNHIGSNFQEAVLISGASASAPEKTFDDMFQNMFKSK